MTQSSIEKKGPTTLPPSGPQVLLETSRALPIISVSVALRWGATQDPQGKEGATRLAARLMRRTAGGRDPQTVDTLIDSLGGALSADVSHSSVVFQGTVITRSFDRFAEILSDTLLRPGLALDEFERLERESESELIEVLDNDGSLARRWFRRRLFGDHAYGRSVSGSLRSLRAVRISDLEDIRRRGMLAENLLFAFSGDIGEEEAQKAAHRVASALPSGIRFEDSTPDPLPRSGRQLVLVDKPERTQTQILIGSLGTRPQDPDHLALHVGNTIFGGTFSARLTREIRAARGWSYGAYSQLPFDRRRHSFSLWTFPNADDAAPCIRHQIGMLEELVEAGVTEEELAHAKRYLGRSHAFAIDTAPKRVGLALDEDLYGLPAGYYEEYKARIEAVTLDEVNAALRQRLNPKNLLTVVVGTESEIGATVREAIDNLESVEVIPFDTDE